MAAVRLQAQISPGPLARPHAALEGATNCAQCHGGRKEPTTQRCLTCHREIAWLRQQSRGFHARPEAQGACSSCHPDHAGRDFRLIQWPGGSPERFDHARRTGYALEQRHAVARCTTCHTAALRTSPAARLAPRPSASVWVGLERDCASCHRDPHAGSLTSDCASCHDTGRWKDAPRFDHARSEYPLTGKHADVPCAKCHLAERLHPPRDSAGAPVPVFKPVPFGDCASCHASPHGNTLSGACRTCHVTSSFATIDRARFDHDRTRYPLRGRHSTVACSGCHRAGSPAETRPPAATCATCHRDPHAGEATVAGRAVDCAACHRVEGFETPTFTVAQHRNTPFPLLGRHATVRCAACHAPTGAAATRRIPIRVASGRCGDCHTDAHGGQLASRGDAGACNTCHSMDGWKPALAGTAAHARTRLPLDGAHAALSCTACHGPDRPGLRPLPSSATTGTARVAFRLPETTCAACHTDPHEWRTSRSAPPPCTACHTTRAFRPTTLDAARHDSTGYPLRGAHRAVACVACHREIERAPARSTLVAAKPGVAPLHLGTAPATCAACHVDPHRGRFRGVGDGSCDGCHSQDAFRPATGFDHARIARFPLEGAHETLACVACHRPATGSVPGAPPAYTGLSARCESCHAKRPSRPRGSR